MSPLKSIRGTLATADYSVLGMEHLIAVERKSLQDFIQCVGRERKRFDQMMERLIQYPVRAMVIEGTITQIQNHSYRGDVTPNAALASAMGWMSPPFSVPILWAETHANAGILVAKYLYVAVKRQWVNSYKLVEALHKN